MIVLISGLILLSIPFVLIDLFSDKKRGFIYILFFSLLFQTILAVLSQSFGIFYYWVVSGFTILADIVALFIYFRIKNKSGNFSISFKISDWVLLAVVLMSLLALYQVHYNYTGLISTATDTTQAYHQERNMVYPYPYFSDEWYAVSLIQGATGNHSLPVKNVLNNTFFPNLELFFHSLIAELMLILGFSPLLQYTALSIFINALIILSVYLFLRISGISKLTSGVSSLFLLYITSGATLPGLWHLIPFNLGILFFILSLCFMNFQDRKLVFLSVILASLFYPPLIPFYFMGLAVFLLSTARTPPKQLFKNVFKYLFLFLLISLIVYIALVFSPLEKYVKYILSRIFFISFTYPFLPQLNFYDIIPWPAIILAIFGVYYIYKNKKWVLLSELILGAVYWILYTQSTYRFFAEYERISIFTSILAVVISGFGFFLIGNYIKSKFKTHGYKWFIAVELLIFIIFVLMVPSYTSLGSWKKNTAINPSTGLVIYPKSPANTYLTQEDIKIFQGIEEKKFLSIPWKGTVIGVATNNYPVLTKQGTISIGSDYILNDFLKADCKNKIQIANKLRLDYIYLYSFNCPEFKKISESSGGLILYSVEQ